MPKGEPTDGGSAPLQPVPRDSVAVERQEPVHYTLGLRAAGNLALSASGLLVLPPLLFLQAVGVGWPVLPLAALLVMSIWVMSVMEHGSLWANPTLRDQAYAGLRSHHRSLVPGSLAFVGICRPGFVYRQVLHSDMAHEDVGMLCATSPSLLFLGDTLRITIPRTAITNLSLRRNPFYSWAGVRWIRLEYHEGGKPHHLYIQSREKDRLSQLTSSNQVLLHRLESWLGRSTMALRDGKDD